MTIKGMTALKLASEISKIPDGTFDIAFYPCSLSSGKVSNKLQVVKGCKTRKQLGDNTFRKMPSDALFCFEDSSGSPKTCHTILIKYMSFPQDNKVLRKIIWFDEDDE